MKPLKIILIGFGVIVAIGLLAIGYIAEVAPDTYVYTKHDFPKRFENQMRELSLLKKGETVQYMYSDALLDLKEGIYAVSDKHLILYNKEWSEPKTIIPFAEIDHLDAEFKDSYLEDSYIIVQTVYGMEVTFPVSSEKGRDHEFFEYLKAKVEAFQ